MTNIAGNVRVTCLFFRGLGIRDTDQDEQNTEEEKAVMLLEGILHLLKYADFLVTKGTHHDDDDMRIPGLPIQYCTQTRFGPRIPPLFVRLIHSYASLH